MSTETSKPKRLLVIISHTLTSLVRKGEITPRYYNPGELFDEVHILMTNSDRPNPSDLQETVGRAKLFLHNIPIDRGPFFTTLGYRPRLLRHWADTAVRLARRIAPDLIRCYGNSVNGFLAVEIKRALRVPVVVSLHMNPEEERVIEAPNWKSRFLALMLRSVENATLRDSDIVMPVYESIRGYAERNGAKDIRVVYNVLSPHLRQKESYELHHPVRIISVGRLLRGKNPECLIRAVADIDADLTLVGDGPLLEHLQRIARACGALGKVKFKRSVPNDQLCEMLPKFDIFAAHSAYSGPPKAVLEPLLTGLPVVLNRCDVQPAVELARGEGSWILLVPNTKEGYLQAIKRLAADDELRERLGRSAYAHARQQWAPDKMEATVAGIYDEVMKKSH